MPHKSCPLRLWLTLFRGCPPEYPKGMETAGDDTMRTEERQNGAGAGDLRPDSRRKSGIIAARRRPRKSTFGRLVVNDGKLVVAACANGARDHDRHAGQGPCLSLRASPGARDRGRLRRPRPSSRPTAQRRLRPTLRPTWRRRVFRFFDNRQKYLLFVSTCSEKTEIANRVSLELSTLQPAPPGAAAIRCRCRRRHRAVAGNARALHARFPTMPALCRRQGDLLRRRAP